jgi:GNAT superfamily N-acetyltransferase
VNPIDQKIVHAFLNSLFCKFENESTASIMDLGEVKGIQYIQALAQPWPRKFQYRLEFFATETSPSQVFERIQSCCADDPQEYVLNVISKNVNVLIPGYKDIGFMHAWNNAIMLHKLSGHEKNMETSENCEVFSVQNAQEVADINALGPEHPMNISGLSDACIFNLYATYKGDIGAKAQAIIVDPQFIYIADMFTHPDFRRKGLSAAMLFRLHQIGLENGCKFAILLPSKMTRNIELFQKFAYSESVSIALLVPGDSPVQAA